MDRIWVTFRHGKSSFDMAFNLLNDIEFIGALPSYSCNIRARGDFRLTDTIRLG